MRRIFWVVLLFISLLSCKKQENKEEVKLPLYYPPTSLPGPPDSLKISPEYKKYIDAGGIPILSTLLTEDDALYRARATVNIMLRNLDTLMVLRMIQKKTRLVIISYQEEISVVPEFLSLPSSFIASRRGLFRNNVAGVFEENLVCEQGLRTDNNRNRDMVTHEFAHAIHVDGGDRTLDSSIRSAYFNAMKNRQYQGLYAATNYKEYWAEGVSFWFNCIPDVLLVSGNSQRAKLKNYDPDLYRLIQRYFSDEIIKTGCY